MKSLTFDRAVSYYDRTRALPREVSDALTDALIELGQLLPGRRCLEVGAGTGRIALPLVARNVDLVGVDLSWAMLARLASKWPHARLVQTDAAILPFRDRSFDVALMVHVLHVIADWKGALLEVQRVVQPGGLLLHVWNHRQQDDIASRLTERFRAIVEARGGSLDRPGAQRREDALAFWAERGWQSEAIEVVRWQEDYTPASHIQSLRDRIWSATWQLSDELLASAVDELTRWAQAEIGPVDRSHPIERLMMIDSVRFTSQTPIRWDLTASSIETSG